MKKVKKFKQKEKDYDTQEDLRKPSKEKKKKMSFYKRPSKHDILKNVNKEEGE